MSRRQSDRDAVTDRPAAPCRLCGETVRDGQGIELSEAHGVHPLRLDGSPIPGSQGRWRRAHTRCHKLTHADVVGILLGMTDIGKVEAARAVEYAGIEPVTAFQRGLREAVSKPWRFVTAEERKALRQALKAVREEMSTEPDGRPRVCVDGACGVCGRSRSRRWWESPLRWADGAPAPVCDECYPTWTRASEPTDLEQQRRVAESIMTGIPRQMGVDHFGMRIAVEILTPKHEGFDGPWLYSPDALREVKHRAWMARPTLIPDEKIRAVFMARKAKLHAERAAALAEERRQSMPGADIEWGAAS